VPTITGQLSFSLIGHTVQARHFVKANVETLKGADHVRHVLVHQKRVAQDLPFASTLAGFIRPWIQLDFILIGRSEPADRPQLDGELLEDGRFTSSLDEIGALRGQVYVVPQPEERVDRQAVDRFLKRLAQRISAIDGSTPRGTICGDYDLDDELALVPALAEQEGVVLLGAAFELYRSGEFRLQIDEASSGICDAIDDANASSATAAGDLCDALAKQMFYFVKDISHRHYHHDSSSDNIVPAYEVVDDDDDAWRRHTLWALSRAVLEHRRRNVLIGHKRALGILAYAEAFQSYLGGVKRLPSGGGFIPSRAGLSFDFSHTRASLQATIDELAFAKSFWSAVQGVAIGSVLALGALWISAVQILGQTCGGRTNCEDPVIPIFMSQLIRASIEMPALPFGALLAAGLWWVVASGRGIYHFRLGRRLSRFIGGWSAAVGASFSRWWRRGHPADGDVVGSWLALACAFLLISFILYVTVGFFSLAPLLPKWATLAGWLEAAGDAMAWMHGRFHPIGSD